MYGTTKRAWFSKPCGVLDLAEVEGVFKYIDLYLLNENPLNLTPKPGTLLFLSPYIHLEDWGRLKGD